MTTQTRRGRSMVYIFGNYLIRLEYMKIRGAYDEFPVFFRMGTFIDSTHIKL